MTADFCGLSSWEAETARSLAVQIQSVLHNEIKPATVTELDKKKHTNKLMNKWGFKKFRFIQYSGVN